MREVQTQMALGQGKAGLLQHRPPKCGGLLQADFEHLRVAATADLIGQHTRPRQGTVALRLIVLQTISDGAKSARHGAGADDGQHGQPKAAGDIGRAGLAIVEPHHAFY